MTKYMRFKNFDLDRIQAFETDDMLYIDNLFNFNLLLCVIL